MNKSLNVFLSVLLCVVLCVGVISSIQTTDDFSVWSSSRGYSPSAATKSGAVTHIGVGSNGNGLSVPISSRPSRGVRGGNSLSSFGGAGGRLLLSPYGGAYGSSSLPSLQVGDGGRLITYMSSSQQTKSFGGGSNGNVSMSNGVVSSSAPSSSTSLIAFSPQFPSLQGETMGMLSLPQELPANDEAYLLAISNELPMRAGISGRRDVPIIGGGESDESSFMNILINICGGAANWSLTDAQLRERWVMYYALHGNAPDYWSAFLSWYQNLRTLPEGTPVGDAIPCMLLLSIIFVVYTYIRRKKINTI